MGEIVNFKPKPKLTELEASANRIIEKLEYLVEGEEHITLALGMLLVGRDGSSIDIKLDNQRRQIKKTLYEPGTNPGLNKEK